MICISYHQWRSQDGPGGSTRQKKRKREKAKNRRKKLLIFMQQMQYNACTFFKFFARLHRSNVNKYIRINVEPPPPLRIPAKYPHSVSSFIILTNDRSHVTWHICSVVTFNTLEKEVVGSNSTQGRNTISVVRLFSGLLLPFDKMSTCFRLPGWST